MPITLPVFSRFLTVSLTTTGETIPRKQDGKKKMMAVIKRIRIIKLVWKKVPPILLVRGEMEKAPKLERKRIQPRVER